MYAEIPDPTRALSRLFYVHTKVSLVLIRFCLCPAYYVAFGPHGPRAPSSKPGEAIKVVFGVFAAIGASGLVYAAIRSRGTSLYTFSFLCLVSDDTCYFPFLISAYFVSCIEPPSLRSFLSSELDLLSISRFDAVIPVTGFRFLAPFLWRM